MNAGRLVIISGPSGAGKGTLVDTLVARVPRVCVSVSATTRPPRPGEVDGVDYHFLSATEFDLRIGRGDFLEWAEVHGNRYGTLRSSVEEKIDQGCIVVLEIDPQGARQIKGLMPHAVLIFIVAPSLEELERRIRRRGAETDEQVRIRLKTAMREMRLVDTYDFVVENDDMHRASGELVAYVRSLSEGHTHDHQA